MEPHSSVPRAGSSVVESDELFGLLVDAVSEYAIFLLGPDGTVRTWNTGAERLKGYRADEIVGRHFAVFYPPEDADAGKPARELAAAARDGSCVDDGWRVRADGSRFWAHVVITALYDGTTLRGFAKVTRDDTTARAAQVRAEALAEIATELLAGSDTDQVLGLVAARARRLVGAIQAWITSPSRDGKISIRAADGSLPGPQAGERLPAAGTVTQRVLDSGEPEFVTDLAAASGLGGRLAGAGAALAVPLVAGGDTIGVLVAAVPAGTSRIRPSDLGVLRQFAGQAAVVLEYDRAQQALRERSVIEDRERIATDLHTDTIRRLFAITMQLHAAASSATSDQLSTRLQDIVEGLDDVIGHIRDVVFELRPGDPGRPDEPAH